MARAITDERFELGDRVRLRDPDTSDDRRLVGTVTECINKNLGFNPHTKVPVVVERLYIVRWDDGGIERFYYFDLRPLDAVERLAELA